MHSPSYKPVSNFIANYFNQKLKHKSYEIICFGHTILPNAILSKKSFIINNEDRKGPYLRKLSKFYST